MVKLKREDDYNVLSRIEDKIDIIQTTLAVTCEKVCRHEKELYGNGQQGMVKDMEDISKDISRAKGYAVGLSAAVSIISGFISHWFKRG